MTPCANPGSTKKTRRNKTMSMLLTLILIISVLSSLAEKHK
jgi:hypothetical protein